VPVGVPVVDIRLLSGGYGGEAGGMGVAVLSDIHGVLPALEAVLAEPDVAGAQRIVVTGDIAAGPLPVQVLDRLMELGERVIAVRGNADRELVAMARGGVSSLPDAIGAWAATQLSPRHVSWLAGLPHPVTMAVAGFGDVLFCHGSPRDDDEVVLVDTRMDRWSDVLRDVPDSVHTIVCGHTHMPFVRLAHGRQIVNSGSVGMPYGRPGAHWALLADGAVTLRRTVYDIDRAQTMVCQMSGYPDVREWTDYFLWARGSDAEALEVFGPRDGRSAST
jgi:predicted phosphodiesterase